MTEPFHPPISLSVALRERTRVAHQESEESTFIAELMRGERSKRDYTLMLTQHFFIYRALESVGATLSADASVAPFLNPHLTRLPAIESDLDFLLGPGWRETVEPLDATVRYVDRVEACASWPGGYVAHHYTRYLGDLSGGQIIRTLLQRHYGFETNGIGFYLFAGIAKPKNFRDTYREQLDAAPWSETEKDRVIAEALVAFRCNTELFADLERATASDAA
ncbi:biliverdin-producing heme oxygenase [soil metagenome]